MMDPDASEELYAVVSATINEVVAAVEACEKANNSRKYLEKAGLFNYEKLSTLTIGDYLTEEARIEEGKPFFNGLLGEIRKILKSARTETFFKFIKCIVPRPILLETLETMSLATFKSRMQTFDKQFDKQRKTPSTFQVYLDQEYLFLPQKKRKHVKSPPAEKTKRALEAVDTVTSLKKTKTTLEKNMIEIQKQSEEGKRLLAEKEQELEEKDLEIRMQQQKLEKLVDDRLKLSQKVKGLQSGISRKQSAMVLDEKLSVTTSTKKISTDIESISNDMIFVTDEEKRDKTFMGIRYFGYKTNFTRKTDGKVRRYVEIPELKEPPCTSVSKKELQRRVHFLEDVAVHIAKDNTQLLYAELVNLNKETFRKGLKESGVLLGETMSSKDAVTIQSLLRLPTNKMRNLRICLNNLKMNVFPSERKMRREKEPITSHVNKDSVETGFIGLRRTKNEENTTACPFLRIKDIVLFLEEIISKDAYGFRFDEHFNGQWWLLFSGDKGALHMKYYVEIVNSLNAGSVDNVHIYSMFEAQDSVENMMKVWYPVYHAQLKAMQKEGFVMKDGRSVQIFLGGDYHFLDDNMGHQGSSSTYPSSQDKILLSHLQNHAGIPHTPQNCPVELRSIQDYIENYNENLADDRAKYNMHENGKYHCSVVGPMIFPLNDLIQVVPPSLHIMLGVVLLIYNLLLDKCKAIDNEDGNIAKQVEEKEKASQEWEIASLELDRFERLLQEHGVNVVIMINHKSRCEAMVKGDHGENTRLAAGSEASRKSKSRRKKKGEEEACHSSFCLITTYDTNVEWVQCDECDQWYHTMCEALTSEEELSLNSKETYVCVACNMSNIDNQDETVLLDIFNNKIAMMLEVEDEINKQKINAKVKCDNLNSTYKNMAGDREKELAEALERIKVVRQAYHGNVMVGNHTVIVLKKYKELTSVIQDRQTLMAYFNEVFGLFSQIMKLVMTRRFLTEEEINRLEELATSFGEKFPIYFPARNITRKIHELVFNLVPFVRKFKTIGMLSEQESESKHAAINAELRALACVRNHAERIRLVFEREELRSYMNKGLLKPKSRLCSKCPRTFLRAANDGKRHCFNCESDYFI